MLGAFVSRREVARPVAPVAAVKVARAANAFDADRRTRVGAPDPFAGAVRNQPGLLADSRETPRAEASPVRTIHEDAAFAAVELVAVTVRSVAFRPVRSSRRPARSAASRPIDLPDRTGTAFAAAYPARTEKVVAERPASLRSRDRATRPPLVVRRYQERVPQTWNDVFCPVVPRTAAKVARAAKAFVRSFFSTRTAPPAFAEATR